MSEELKFRGWSESVKKMTYFDNPIITSSELKDGETWGLFLPSTNGIIYLSSYQAMMQYIRKKDQNEQEIFSGDIVQQFDNVYIVEDYPGGWRLKITRSPLDGAIGCTVSIDLLLKDYCKVVGSIMENPEFLEPAKEAGGATT